MESAREAGRALLVGQGGKKRAWKRCSNACLLARALEENDQTVFASGGEVLEHLTAEQIGALAGTWAAFNREVNPAPTDGAQRVEALKKVWSTRRKNGCGGAC